MRKIPTSMATQHPDNAARPFWQSRPFVSTTAEIKESFICFSELGIDEYNWDWEGKFVDEAVLDRLLHLYYKYFRKHPLGNDKFLTFRIPNPRVETQFRLARAFMVAITSSQLSQSLGFENHPIFETILPLTETPEEIIDIQEAFKHLVSVEHKLLKMKDSIQYIEIIPLFEQVSKITESAQILKKYFLYHRKIFGRNPDYLRPYCARSDPALNSGIVPTMLAIKIALSDYLELEKEEEIKLYPMLGTGSLPFRGGLSPERIDEALNEYRGVRTFTVQSAFRYDFPVDQVKHAIRKMSEVAPGNTAATLTSGERKNLIDAIPQFEHAYTSTVEKIAKVINEISLDFPKRRERLQHIGLFGYSRGIGKVKLPRAITFTGSLYSIGIPPELIGTGRGLRSSQKLETLSAVRQTYRNLKKDLQHAGRFLNRGNLEILAKQSVIWYDVVEDVRNIEKVLGIELGPVSEEEKEHAKITSWTLKRVQEKKSISALITESGILRKSLG